VKNDGPHFIVYKGAQKYFCCTEKEINFPRFFSEKTKLKNMEKKTFYKLILLDVYKINTI
jgi:hypothetical protein